MYKRQAIDSTYKTPIFKVVAGQSSCPWEPGTAKREGVLLTSVDGPVRTDVPANEPAVYRFLLGNISATNESRSYAFKAGPKSNPDGAKISCNGCLLYTSDAADERSSVDLGGRRIIKKKKRRNHDGRLIMHTISRH